MKTLLLSDIQGNWPALQAVLAAEPEVDQILCLGDLVNYGPQPAECVRWAMGLGPSNVIIQGNHDRAFGCGEDPHCSAAYQVVAAAVQAATGHLLTVAMKRFLAGLDPLQTFERAGARCVACHATPGDPPYRYLGEESAMSIRESELVRAGHPDFLFLGHTHQPMKTQFQRTLVVNPGSVGQPKDGDARAAYPMGVLADKFSKRAILSLGFALFGILCLGFLLADNRKWILVALFALVGIYTAIIESSQPALALTLMSEDQHGAGFGLMSAVDGVGDFLSSVTMGVLWTTVSPNTGFAAAGALALFSAGLLYLLRFSRPATGNGSDVKEIVL
jgi:predicted phosphodiesterase